VGPGLLDLAALTGGTWTPAERERLVLAYHAAWAAAGRTASLSDLREALACARLQVALQWIGWSRRWSPPAEHAHDWFGEAERAARELAG
jgi:hypothetical protein